MSTFKFACPVCGQHIECAADKAGLQMECPTCFRKLVVPQPSAEGSSSLVLSASEVHTRAIPLPGSTVSPTVSKFRAKKTPVIAIALGVLVLAAAAGVIVFRGKIFSPRNQPDGNSTAEDTNQLVQAGIPATTPGDDKLWLTNLSGATIPDAPAAGRVSGKSFTIQRAAIKGGQLDLRQGPKWPPDVGLSVFLFANQSEDLAGRSVNIAPDRGKSPRVVLRTRDEQGQPVNEDFSSGYSLRVEFGPLTSGKLPGKIYFCAPDASKSYVIGTFNAEIRKPTTPRKKP